METATRLIPRPVDEIACQPKTFAAQAVGIDACCDPGFVGVDAQNFDAFGTLCGFDRHLLALVFVVGAIGSCQQHMARVASCFCPWPEGPHGVDVAVKNRENVIPIVWIRRQLQHLILLTQVQPGRHVKQGCIRCRCRALVQPAGGEIRLEQRVGFGLTDGVEPVVAVRFVEWIRPDCGLKSGSENRELLFGERVSPGSADVILCQLRNVHPTAIALDDVGERRPFRVAHAGERACSFLPTLL